MTGRGVGRYPYLHRQTVLISIHHSACVLSSAFFCSFGSCSRGFGLNKWFVGLYRLPSFLAVSLVQVFYASISTVACNQGI